VAFYFGGKGGFSYQTFLPSELFIEKYSKDSDVAEKVGLPKISLYFRTYKSGTIGAGNEIGPDVGRSIERLIWSPLLIPKYCFELSSFVGKHYTLSVSLSRRN